MLSSLIVLAPALVLLFGAAILLVMRLTRSAAGNIWIVAALTVVAAWIAAMFTRIRLPSEWIAPGWQDFSSFLNTISFTADRLSWPLAAALVTLALGVIFTDSARFTHVPGSSAWSGSLAITSIGVLAALSSQPLGLILGWTALDLIEFILLIGVASDARAVRRVIAALGYKFAGTVIVIGILTANPLLVSGSGKVVLSSQASIALLAGIALRLGALPLHPPFYRDLPLRRGLGTVLRLAPAAPTLVFMARFTPERMEWGAAPVVLVILALSALYASWMWHRSEDELSGRPFFIIALASLAITSSLRGHSEGVIAWGVTLILSGGLLFLFSARTQRFLFLPFLGLIGISGLPYTPAASAWPGLTGEPLPGLVVIYIISTAALMAGYLKKARRPADSLEKLERWVSLVYPLGLVIMAFTTLLMGFFGWPGSRTIGIWWASFASVLLAAGAFAAGQLAPQVLFGNSRIWIFFSTLSSSTRTLVQRFLEFDWLNRILTAGYNILALLVAQVAFLLEGDAGVLWTVVLLTLFLTILNTGVSP